MIETAIAQQGLPVLGLPQVSRALDQSVIDLCAIDHGYNPSSKETLDIATFGHELANSHQEKAPILFVIPNQTTVTFYEPEIAIKDNGNSRRCVPLVTTGIDNLAIEVLPAAKAIIFRNVAYTRASESMIRREDESSKAPDSHRMQFASIIEHPNERDRVTTHQGSLHVGDPNRPPLGHLELVQDGWLSSESRLHFVYKSNDGDGKVIRRFSINFESTETRIQKLDALPGYEAGFYEYSNVVYQSRGQEAQYEENRVRSGLLVSGNALGLTPHLLDLNRKDIDVTYPVGELANENLGTETLGFKDPHLDLEMFSRVRNPHSIYSRVQQLFVGPMGSGEKMESISKAIRENFKGHIWSSLAEESKRPVFMVEVRGESVRLAHDIARVVFGAFGDR